MRIGILGGTFDPIHLGHLIIAEEVRIKLGLNEVIFIPTGRPWLKVDHTVTPAIQRTEMVRLAIEGNPYFKLCTLEVERTGPSYSVDTVATLREQLGEQPFFFILGSDSITELHLWKEPSRLVQMCKLVVVPRVGLSPPDLNSLEISIPGVSDRVIQLDAPVIDISSSEIRQRLARGLSVRYLVPDEVERYIAREELYCLGKIQEC